VISSALMLHRPHRRSQLRMLHILTISILRNGASPGAASAAHHGTARGGACVQRQLNLCRQAQIRLHSHAAGQ